MYWSLLGILLAVALVGCAIGFKKFVYFLSVGYGFAIALCSITIFIMIGLNKGGYSSMTWLLVIQCLIFVLYGVRLSGFLLHREIRSASYRKVLKEATKGKDSKNESKMPIVVKITIWLTVGVLYVALVAPVLFRHMNECTDWILPIIGVVISIIGLVLETLADMQKTIQKKINAHMFVSKGLYRMCRCPNYFGEIVFWTGIFVAGITCYRSVGEWLIAILGYISIVYVMFSGAQRLEKRQNKNYGLMPEYQEYVKHTPALFPLIPIYHLVKVNKDSNNTSK